MRLSELLALKWKGIDYNKKQIKVYESSHYSVKEKNEKNAHHINCLKEKKIKALVDITDEDVMFLKQHKVEQTKRRLRYKGDYTDNDLVFAKNDGTHIRNDTASRNFSEFASSNGFSVTFHCTRHTHITLLLAAGVALIRVAERVGHQRPSTTTDGYSHVKKADHINLAEIFKDVLKGGKAIAAEEFAKAQAATIRILRTMGELQ